MRDQLAPLLAGCDDTQAGMRCTDPIGQARRLSAPPGAGASTAAGRGGARAGAACAGTTSAATP